MFDTSISHRDRIKALKGNEKLDRIPIAFWRHFPVDDQVPERLADATLNFQETYDFDLIKVTPSSSFCLKDWGAEDKWEGNPEGTRRYTKRVIESPSDWEKLATLDPKKGFLGQQLKCLKLLQGIRQTTPIVQTIFNPLSQAKNLVGEEQLLTHLRLFPDAIQCGLDTIVSTTKLFIEAAVDTGIDGIFYAIQHARSGSLSKEEYAYFGKSHDLEILSISESLFFNILHLHGASVYFNEICNYPVASINWHDRDTPPNLAVGSKIFKGILCGGLRRETISLGNDKSIKDEIKDAVTQVKENRLIIGTGCVVPVIAPHGNLRTARKYVEEVTV
jgi:uroporphyrinogen decarboxylase